MKRDTEPGRDLDRMVAEKVFGYEVGMVGDKFVYRSPGGCGTYECQRLHAKDLPEFSTDIAAAWPVVEKLKDRVIDLLYHPEADAWSVMIGDLNTTGYTAPHAICLAALRAIE